MIRVYMTVYQGVSYFLSLCIKDFILHDFWNSILCKEFPPSR